METILIRILIAHSVTDFILQPKKWVLDKREKKAKSFFLYLHAFITGIAAYIFIGHLNNFVLPLYITITHLFIDLWKSYQKDNLTFFISDQLLHLIVLVSGWLFFIKKDFLITGYLENIFNNYPLMIILLGYIVIIFPLDYVIKLATDNWKSDINLQENNVGLKDAGKWIGKLERVMILTFILTDNLSAIGFLIAAKSIFRFAELKDKQDRKVAEYILIGTLLSFASAIIVGVLILYII